MDHSGSAAGAEAGEAAVSPPGPEEGLRLPPAVSRALSAGLRRLPGDEPAAPTGDETAGEAARCCPLADRARGEARPAGLALPARGPVPSASRLAPLPLLARAAKRLPLPTGTPSSAGLDAVTAASMAASSVTAATGDPGHESAEPPVPARALPAEPDGDGVIVRSSCLPIDR